MSASGPPKSQRAPQGGPDRLAFSSLLGVEIPNSHSPTHTRVILVSRDRRFLKVAGFILTRRGAGVTTVRSVADASKHVEREGADLVVLDAGDSLREAGEGIGGLAKKHPGLEVVVVAEDAESLPQGLEFRLWPKWQRLETLLSLVEPAAQPAVDADPQLVS
jgi:hypothetical protein